MKKEEPMLNIAYAVDNEDNDLSFCFRGVSIDTVCDLFNWLGAGRNAFQSYSVCDTPDAIKRNGKSTHYLNVRIIHPNEHFCSVNDLALLIEARMHALVCCKITKMTINRFLNV